MTTPSIIINGINYPVELKTTHEGIMKGMMGRRVMDRPMVFLFPYSDDKSFFMLNCLIPLDIVFTDNGKITKIYNNCKPCDKEPCKTYTAYANMVVEFAGGFCEENNIEEGQILKINLK